MLVWTLCLLMTCVYAQRPWITHQPAVVMDLECRAPYWNAWRDKWHSVDELEITCKQCQPPVYAHYNLGEHKQLNTTGFDDKRPMAVVRNITDQNKRALYIRMPITEREHGPYNCRIRYQPESAKSLMDLNYSVNLSQLLKEHFVDGAIKTSNHSFFVNVSRVHNVTVTWSIQTSDPVDLKIHRNHLGLDKDRHVTTFSTFLANEKRQTDSSVLLVKVLSNSKDDNSNFTMSVYVEDKFCFPNCSYQCSSSLVCSQFGDEPCCEGPSVNALQIHSDTCQHNDGSNSVEDGCVAASVLAGVFGILFVLLLIPCLVHCCCHRLCEDCIVLRRKMCCPASLPAVTARVLAGKFVLCRQNQRVRGARPEEPTDEERFVDDPLGLQQWRDEGAPEASEFDSNLGGQQGRQPMLEQAPPPTSQREVTLENAVEYVVSQVREKQDREDDLTDAARNREFTKTIVLDAGMHSKQTVLIAESDDFILLTECHHNQLLHWFCKKDCTTDQDEKTLMQLMSKQKVDRDDRYRHAKAEAERKLDEIKAQIREAFDNMPEARL